MGIRGSSVRHRPIDWRGGDPLGPPGFGRDLLALPDPPASSTKKCVDAGLGGAPPGAALSSTSSASTGSAIPTNRRAGSVLTPLHSQVEALPLYLFFKYATPQTLHLPHFPPKTPNPIFYKFKTRSNYSPLRE